MELFAAATGCSDPKVASLYLERAGNEVTIAVNHFLDAPPPIGSLAENGLHPLMSLAKADNKQQARTQSASMIGTRRDLKRPRDGGSVQQELLSFQPPCPRSNLQDQTTGFPLSDSNPEQQPEFIRDSMIQRLESMSSYRPSPGATASLRENKHDVAPLWPPSTEWTEIAERCRR